MSNHAQTWGAPSRTRISQLPFGMAGAICLVIFLLIAGLSLWLNAGSLIFSLDDSYILFALANHLMAGHYGINPHEYAAPSSSVIWPALIMAFTLNDTLLPYAVLSVNAACALATLYCYWDAIPPDAKVHAKPIRTAGLLLLCFVIANQFTHAFTGLEHSLQVLICNVMVLGLLAFARDQRVHWWWLASIVLAPLLRYECLALSVFNLAFLAYRGRRLLAAGVLLTMAAPLLAFSTFLLDHGLGILPTSIIAKGNISKESTRLFMWIYNLKQNALSIKGGLLTLLALGLTYYCCRPGMTPRRMRGPALVLTGATLAHLVLGRTGYRYDAYLWSSVVVYVLSVHWDWLNALQQRQAWSVRKWASQPAQAFALLVVVGIFAKSTAYTLATPVATNNIYEQQFQMRRFVQNHYRGSVAVNDLGYVAYKNDQYVLDLGGLASMEVVQRNQRGEPMWWGPMTQEHDVHLIMIYENQYNPIPPTWIKLGTLALGHMKLSAAEPTVTFFATDCQTTRQTVPKLKVFATELPEKATFKLSEGIDQACVSEQVAVAHP
jgi:hypothetical protein